MINMYVHVVGKHCHKINIFLHTMKGIWVE
uniref:Uncharacterized protein n=2 Tax=unclassified Caudoviricetes TaxID=2788787 RepID=A0A8S5PIM9_9CAUD|nr:MAG TPA: hypothetical protein [Siphoviridae sp. ctJcm18]DAE06576.1 MAG TPA: hypothetical protein [Siphoviridae sp. ctUGQ45]